MTNETKMTRRQQEAYLARNHYERLYHQMGDKKENQVSLTDESSYQGDRSLLSRLQHFGDKVQFDVGINHAKPLRSCVGQGNFTYEAEHYEPKYSVRVKKVDQRKTYGDSGLDCFGSFVIELFDARGDSYSGRYVGVRHFSESAARFAYSYAKELAEEISKETGLPILDGTLKGVKKAWRKYRKSK